MSKAEYMKKHGLTLWKVTREDQETARTDYQHDAEYIISNGVIKWYSKRGTLNDMKEFVKAREEELYTVKAEATKKLTHFGYDGKSITDEYVKITAYFHGKPSRVLTKAGYEIYL